MSALLFLTACPDETPAGMDGGEVVDAAVAQPPDASVHLPQEAGSDAQMDAGLDAAVCAPVGYTTALDAGATACPDSPGPTGPGEVSARIENDAGASWRVHRNWTYGVRGGRALQGDLYIPERGDSEPGGLIFGIHGGGWEDCGRRRSTGQVVRFLQRLSQATGASFFTVDYRLSQEGGQYPENVKDVRCALQYVRSRLLASPQLGVDANRVVAIGESAGAHLALMLALTEGRDDLDPHCSYAEGVVPSAPLAAAYAFSAPTDLPMLATSGGLAAPSPQHYTNGACTTEDSADATACGCPADNRCVDASPLHHWCGAHEATDVVLIHAPRTAEGGEYDLFLPFRHAERLRDAFAGSPRFQLWVPDDRALLDRGCYGSTYIIDNGVVRPDGTLIPFAHGFMECLTDAVFPLLELAVETKVGGGM